jgi:hypothetical protein
MRRLRCDCDAIMRRLRCDCAALQSGCKVIVRKISLSLPLSSLLTLLSSLVSRPSRSSRIDWYPEWVVILKELAHKQSDEFGLNLQSLGEKFCGVDRYIIQDPTMLGWERASHHVSLPFDCALVGIVSRRFLNGFQKNVTFGRSGSVDNATVALRLHQATVSSLSEKFLWILSSE